MNTIQSIRYGKVYMPTIDKLIKSSIYAVGEYVARYTGDLTHDADMLPVFRVHDTHILQGGHVRKATVEQVNAYLGR